MRRISEERGLALVPAVGAIVVVMMIGATLLATVNVQSSQSGAQSAEEGSFQIAEGALEAQVLQVSRTWPTAAAPAGTCNQASTSGSCPGQALTANFTGASSAGAAPNGGAYFESTPAWTTRVIDDVGTGGSSYYSDSLATQTPAPCACDANGNGAVWIRSEAQVGGRSTVLVSLVEQSAPQLETLPRSSIIAGYFQTTNNGKKVIVDALGNSGTAGNVSVRCATGPDKDDPCLGYDPGKGQLSPANAYQSSYVDGTGAPNASNRFSLDAQALERLKLRAQTLGTYYATGCPSTLSGALVYIENPTNATCSYTSNENYNSAAAPGVVIFGGGTLSLGGTSAYYGLIYNANRQGSAPATGPCTDSYMNPVITLNGGTEIHGAIIVDKCGGVIAGSNKVNVTFDANVFNNVVSNGAAGNVKNSFRVLPDAN